MRPPTAFCLVLGCCLCAVFCVLSAAPTHAPHAVCGCGARDEEYVPAHLATPSMTATEDDME